MEIGIIAERFERWSENRYKKLKEIGFSCVDYGLSNTDSEIYSCDENTFKAKLLKEKELADKAGISIVQTHGPWRYPPQDNTAEQRGERMEKMAKAIYGTSLLGCKNIVIHPLMPFGTSDIEVGKEKETFEINIEFFSALAKRAQEYGVTVCLENMPMTKFSLAKPSDILRVVKTVNSENLKVCLDTGHVAVFKDKLSLYQETKLLGKYLCALHVHDNTHGRDLHMPPYFGIIDWESFAKALKEIEYKGVFSLETSPPVKLPEPIFTEMCASLYKIAKEITKDI